MLEKKLIIIVVDIIFFCLKMIYICILIEAILPKLKLVIIAIVKKNMEH